MIERIRLFVVLTRPAVAALLALFVATGLAEAGLGNDTAALVPALVAVMGFLVFSVALNDVADEAIDRVNLPGDPGRPLASGRCTRLETIVLGVTAGAVALGASALLPGPALAVIAAGLALSAGYSLRPVRIADRGALASLLLPAAYVAVPYLVGLFGARSSLHPADLVLLAGLYIGFIGRILLKDFRDVRGDALFGKRTFLVRHGRRPTCAVSAACWATGAAMLVGVRNLHPALVAAEALCVAAALVLLRHLSHDRGPRRDEALISTLAIIGRGMVLLVLAHLSIADRSTAYLAVVGMLTTLTLGQAWTMLSRGPRPRLTVPADWTTEEAGRSETSAPSIGDSGRALVR